MDNIKVFVWRYRENGDVFINFFQQWEVNYRYDPGGYTPMKWDPGVYSVEFYSIMNSLSQ
mgnify:CR=1 FL=1